MGTYKTINGWVDFSIHQLFQGMREEKKTVPQGMDWTVISCLDSCPDVYSLVTQSQHFKFSQEDYKPLGRTIAIKTKKLLHTEHEKRIFFGFDEVWFMRETSLNRLLYLDQLFYNFRFNNQEQIEIFWMGSPVLLPPSVLDEVESEQIQRFMVNFDISGGFGDGIGMNYRISESQNFLLGYMLQQAGTVSNYQR
jgi:hypothetical protein